MLYRVHLAWAGFKLTTLVVIGTHCIGSCKSNYHIITTTNGPYFVCISHILHTTSLQIMSSWSYNCFCVTGGNIKPDGQTTEWNPSLSTKTIGFNTTEAWWMFINYTNLTQGTSTSSPFNVMESSVHTYKTSIPNLNILEHVYLSYKFWIKDRYCESIFTNKYTHLYFSTLYTVFVKFNQIGSTMYEVNDLETNHFIREFTRVCEWN
jgi:hypothetical protein